MSADPNVTVVTEATPYKITASDGHHQWSGDEPKEAGGGDVGPSPVTLLLSSLGACTAITLKMYAAHKKWDLQKVEVRLAINPEGKPEDGSTRMDRHITVSGDLTEEQRMRLLEIANKCPVHKILTGTIKIGTDLAAA